MPGVLVNGRDGKPVRWPSVSTEIFGRREGKGDNASDVTLFIRRDDAVQLGEHNLLVEYAHECLVDRVMNLADYADQIFAPRPADGHYVEVDVAFDHDGNTSKVILFTKGGTGRAARLYEWAI